MTKLNDLTAIKSQSENDFNNNKCKAMRMSDLFVKIIE